MFAVLETFRSTLNNTLFIPEMQNTHTHTHTQQQREEHPDLRHSVCDLWARVRVRVRLR